MAMSTRINIRQLRKELDQKCRDEPGPAGKLATKKPSLDPLEDSAAPWFAWVNDVGSIFRRASGLVWRSEKHKDTLIRRAVMAIKELADEAGRAYKTIRQLEDLVKRLQKELEQERQKSAQLKQKLAQSLPIREPIRERIDATQKVVEKLSSFDM